MMLKGVLAFLALTVLAVNCYTDDETALRDKYNVATFRSTSFSATFVIFVGTAIILVGGVMLATCSLIEIEPGKDSLVYRGSASRGVPKVE
ncbi:hypothetical protein ACHWQZ_G005682 [Mnemiopsis leidyi]